MPGDDDSYASTEKLVRWRTDHHNRRQRQRQQLLETYISEKVNDASCNNEDAQRFRALHGITPTYTMDRYSNDTGNQNPFYTVYENPEWSSSQPPDFSDDAYNGASRYEQGYGEVPQHRHSVITTQEKPDGPRRGSTKPPDSLQISKWREGLFIAICAVSHLMTQAGLGEALAPIDLIAPTFGTLSPGEQSWFIAAYSLTVGTFIMISGRLGDIFGHKRVFVCGYAWLSIWSCFAGFSAYTRDAIFFDACRAMQGIGPALLMPNALALFGRAYPQGKKKNIVFSIFGALAPTGFVIGATFGSLFAQLAWWPWAFWSYGITAAVLAVLALLIIPDSLSPAPENRPSFDWRGSVLVVAGLVLINVAFNNGPLYRWSSSHVIVVLIIGLLCIGAFAHVERRAKNPLLPVRALNSTVYYVLGLVGVGWGSFGIWVFYNVRFLQHIRQATPLSIAAQYSPAALAGLIAAGMTAFLITHTPVSFVMMISMMAFCLGIIVACFQPAQQIYWAQTFVSILIMPFGMDMSFPAATLILSNHLPHEHQGMAASLVNTVVNYSISIALGIAGTVEVYAPHEDVYWQNRQAMYAAIGLSGLGVLLGAVFFARSLYKDGWVIMAH